MKHNFTKNNCLSYEEIRTYINKALTKEEAYLYDTHFSICKLCSEAKEQLEHSDSIEIDQDIALLQDTVLQTIPKTKSIRKSAPIPWKIAASILLPIIGLSMLYFWSSSNPDAIFEHHFEAYAIKEINSNQPIDVPTNYSAPAIPENLQLALEQYQNGNYGESLPHFKTYQAEQPFNTYATLLYSNALLEVGYTNKAIELLSEIRKNDQSLADDANWYLSLAYIKNKKIDKAKELLQELSSKNDGLYHSKAISLLNEL